jgi:hypothetical protein
MSRSREKDLAHDVLAEEAIAHRPLASSPWEYTPRIEPDNARTFQPYFDGSGEPRIRIEPSPDSLAKLADVVPPKSKPTPPKTLTEPSENAKQLLERLRRIKEPPQVERPVDEMAQLTKEVHELLVRLRDLRSQSHQMRPPSK